MARATDITLIETKQNNQKSTQIQKIKNNVYIIQISQAIVF